MKLLITSDIHGAIDRLKALKHKHRDIDIHLDAGDICLDQHDIMPFHMTTVKGNNDFYSQAPYYRILDIDGMKVCLTHGHIEHVKANKQALFRLAKAHDAKLVIFGHTHKRCLETDEDITILNPGALGDYQRSYAIIDNGQITFYEL